MPEKLIAALVSEGTLIGFFAGLMKVLSSIRTGDFKWFIALTDIIGSTVFGYTTFEWASSSDVLSIWQIYLLTVFSSLNAFLIIKVFTEPSVFKKLIASWLKIDFDQK